MANGLPVLPKDFPESNEAAIRDFINRASEYLQEHQANVTDVEWCTSLLNLARSELDRRQAKASGEVSLSVSRNSLRVSAGSGFIALVATGIAVWSFANPYSPEEVLKRIETNQQQMIRVMDKAPPPPAETEASKCACDSLRDVQKTLVEIKEKMRPPLSGASQGE